MKKLLIALGLICGLGFVTNPINQVVYADEVVETPTEEEGEIEDDVVVDDNSTDSDVNIDDTTEDNSEINNIITEKIDELIESDLYKTIIGYVLDFGFLSSIIVLAIKLSGEKKSRKQLEKTLTEVVEKEFKKISYAQNVTLTDFTKKIIDDVELLKVAVALSQDKSNESKLELLKLISGSTNSKTHLETFNSVKNNVEEQKKKVDEIKEKLTKDYKEIF